MYLPEILSYLTAQHIFPVPPTAEPIRTGASGAKLYVLSCGKQRYVLKSAHPSRRAEDPDWIRSYRKEAAFYRLWQNHPDRPDFVPAPVWAEEHPEYGVLLVLTYHAPILHGAWNEELLTMAMDTCARLNALDPAVLAPLGLAEDHMVIERDATERAYEAWQKVLHRHTGSLPGRFDEALLAEVYRNLAIVCPVLNNGPMRVCHGDCHPENVLLSHAPLDYTPLDYTPLEYAPSETASLSGGGMLICDWQNLHIGKSVGDVSFFISRGSGFGIPMDENRLLDVYCDRLARYTGTPVRKRDLLREKAASSLLNVFMGWPYHLLDCPAEWAALRFDEMADSYRALL